MAISHDSYETGSSTILSFYKHASEIKKMELLGAIDLVLQIILIILSIAIIVILVKIYKNLMLYLRHWDRFYGYNWLYGQPQFE